MKEKLIEVKDLKIDFMIEGVPRRIIDNISFEIYRGEVLGVVGESGSGKTVTAKSILRLLPNPPGKIVGGEILFDGTDILQMDMDSLMKIRGNAISMIFQEPMSSLNPVFTCGDQIKEGVRLHQNMDNKAARQKAIDLLKMVGIPMPEQRIDSYPHELSGGMRQRIMIAMALICSPQLLIADEPTTALDPTIQAQILDLIRKVQKEIGMSVMYITHDLGVVAETCDRVMVMYAGQIVEKADVAELFTKPGHPYTQGLLKAIPRLNTKRERLYVIKGMVPHFADMPVGCSFHPRCPYADNQCVEQKPTLREIKEGHLAACWKIQGTADLEWEEGLTDGR
jgi:oligopeptide/dipeptide ABC transporter ATP-binding protein